MIKRSGRGFMINGSLAMIGETTRSVTKNILATWDQASPDDLAAGADWYQQAGRQIDQLAARVRRQRETVGAVVAHMSPRTPWRRTLEGATAILTGEQPQACLGANVARARAAIASADPLGTLNGPKTLRFARNMLGDQDVVTIDVWALRVALGGRTVTLDKKGILYAAFEHCYRLAARRAGVTPAVIQATTWIVARNGRKD